MAEHRSRRAGAALLIAGGALEAAALVVAESTLALSTTTLGALVLGAYAGAWLLVGTGLIVTGYASTVRGRIAMRIAGALAWVVGIVEAVQFVIGAHFGPAPALFTFSAYVVALVVAGLRLLSDRTVRPGARWSIAIPAIGIIAGVAIGYLPLVGPALSLPGILLPWVGYVVAGLLLIGSVRDTSGVTAHPVLAE